MARRAAGPLAAALAALLLSPAPAQDDEPSDVFLLDAIVVTGIAAETTKVKTSVSISTIDAGDLAPTAPRSTAEIFRNIPGIRSEATSGDGNANIAVRGLPVAAGGAKFLQLQEDGLPILEFGDIAFGTADSFLRPDFTVSRLEAVRGGSASTFASNSPGGIINFISKTGAVAGGSIGLTGGLDFDSQRLDFDYGAPIDENTRFHVGGYYRSGEGPRDADFDGNEGFQLKGNVTRFFENGHLRLYFKHLDDSAITYLPMPVLATGTNANPHFGRLPGFDPKDDTPHTPHLSRNPGTDGDGNLRVSDVEEGLKTRVDSVGAELALTLANDWKLTDRFRVSDVRGRFVSPFPAQIAPAQEIADSIAGPGAQLSFANGPNAGQAIGNPGSLNGNGLLMRTHLFDTELNDFGNVINDLKVSRVFNAGDAGSYDLAFGYYKSIQDIDMDWLWNTYLLEVKGSSAALIDVADADGQLFTDDGLAAFGVPFWGALHRSYDAEYDIDAPYLSLAYEKGRLNIDASLRHDAGEASGSYAGTAFQSNRDIDGDGSISVPEQNVAVVDNANRLPIDYRWNYTSYSIGGNFSLNENLALFARYSHGGRANADRLLFGPNVLPDGSLRDKSAAVDRVDQLEGGVKYRDGDFLGGELELFATVFYTETEEQNFEATTQLFFDRDYEALGLELESAYRHGNFSLRGGITLTDAEISGDALNPSVVGNTPRRQADVMFQLSPTYATQRWSVGANIIGTSEAFAQDDNVLEFPSYEYVNLHGSYNLTENLTALLTVNNVFDQFGLSESEQGAIPANGIIAARGISGRSSTLSLTYRF